MMLTEVLKNKENESAIFEWIMDLFTNQLKGNRPDVTLSFSKNRSAINMISDKDVWEILYIHQTYIIYALNILSDNQTEFEQFLYKLNRKRKIGEII
jgi:hypothetical protein